MQPLQGSGIIVGGRPPRVTRADAGNPGLREAILSGLAAVARVSAARGLSQNETHFPEAGQFFGKPRQNARKRSIPPRKIPILARKIPIPPRKIGVRVHKMDTPPRKIPIPARKRTPRATWNAILRPWNGILRDGKILLSVGHPILPGSPVVIRRDARILTAAHGTLRIAPRLPAP